MNRYVQFTVFNEVENRPATKEEIEAHVRLIVIDEDHGVCEVNSDEAFSILTD